MFSPVKNGGLRSFLRSPIFDIFQFVLLITILCLLAVHSAENIGYNWQWYQIPRYLLQPLIQESLPVP
jgi:polar amino acid transport system permease protein